MRRRDRGGRRGLPQYVSFLNNTLSSSSARAAAKELQTNNGRKKKVRAPVARSADKHHQKKTTDRHHHHNSSPASSGGFMRRARGRARGRPRARAVRLVEYTAQGVVAEVRRLGGGPAVADAAADGTADGIAGLAVVRGCPEAWRKPLAAALRAGLPAGYPASVTPDYPAWLRWHAASLFLRDVLEVLSSQSLVLALGLDGAAATGAVPLAAATKWVLKDGVGSLATLAVGTRGGQRFDEDPKRWWCITSGLEDVARAIELSTPLFPAAFLPLAAAGECRCGTPAKARRADRAAPGTFVRAGSLVGRNSLVNGTIMRHLGTRENFSDVRAKLEASGRILALVSLPLGIGIFKLAGPDAPSLLALYASIFAGHNFACYKAAQQVGVRGAGGERGGADSGSANATNATDDPPSLR